MNGRGACIRDVVPSSFMHSAVYRKVYKNQERKCTMNIPNHVAIILDGNGRWAKAKGLPRTAGHVQGAKTVEQI